MATERRYSMGSVIRMIGEDHPRRYAVLALASDHYIVQAMFGSLEPDTFFWRIKPCENETELEWQKPYPLIEHNPKTRQTTLNPDLIQEELWMTDKTK